MKPKEQSANGNNVREQLKKSKDLGREMSRSGNGVVNGLRRAASELRRANGA